MPYKPPKQKFTKPEYVIDENTTVEEQLKELGYNTEKGMSKSEIEDFYNNFGDTIEIKIE